MPAWKVVLERILSSSLASVKKSKECWKSLSWLLVGDYNMHLPVWLGVPHFCRDFRFSMGKSFLLLLYIAILYVGYWIFTIIWNVFIHKNLKNGIWEISISTPFNLLPNPHSWDEFNYQLRSPLLVNCITFDTLFSFSVTWFPPVKWI